MTTPLDPQQRQLVEALIRNEWPKLERFFRTKVPSEHIGELAQATFLTYVENAARATSPRAFLWGIARLQVLKHWERHRTRGAQPFDSTRHSLLDVGPTLSSAVDRRNRLVRALQALPADQQMAIELRHGEELSLEEAASAMEVSLATFKRYLAAAEERLAVELGPEAPEVVRAYRAS